MLAETISEPAKPKDSLPHYQKIHISSEKAESCTFGDLNNDGIHDIITGSSFFLGPDFSKGQTFRKLRFYHDKVGQIMSPDDFTLAKDVTGDGYVDIISGRHDYGLFMKTLEKKAYLNNSGNATRWMQNDQMESKIQNLERMILLGTLTVGLI